MHQRTIGFESKVMRARRLVRTLIWLTLLVSSLVDFRSKPALPSHQDDIRPKLSECRPKAVKRSCRVVCPGRHRGRSRRHGRRASRR
jgi:hypothetical protein